MKPITYKHGNLVLDDWVKNEDPDLNDNWTQLCPKHAKQVQKIDMLDESGSGTCGVEGCWEESEFYLDFDNQDIEVEY